MPKTAFSPRPCGALPSPRHVIAGATPHLAVGVTPAEWCWLPQKLSYWLNDVDGICVTAEEAFARACSGVFIGDAVVRFWAAQHNALNGAVIAEVLDWMAASGFPQDGNRYDAGSKSAVDWTNAEALHNAIAKGPVKIGVAAAQLQHVVKAANGWLATGFHKDRNLDHCVSLCGYGQMGWLYARLGVAAPAGTNVAAPGYHLFTWDTIGVIDVPSMVAITGEAWLRVPTTVVRGNGTPSPDTVVTPPPPGPVPPTPEPTPRPPPAPVPTPSPTLQQVLAMVERAFAEAMRRVPRPFRFLVTQVEEMVLAAVTQAWPKSNSLGTPFDWRATVVNVVETVLDDLAAQVGLPWSAIVTMLEPLIVEQLRAVLGTA